MAYTANTAVRCVDMSSEFYNRGGKVISVTGDNHQVRIDGQACHRTATLRTDQLKTDAVTRPTNYGLCVG